MDTRNLPRHQFGNLQSKMFPAYFWLVGVCCAISVASFGYLHPWKSASAAEKYQLGFLLSSLAFNLANLFVFTPMTIEVQLLWFVNSVFFFQGFILTGGSMCNFLNLVPSIIGCAYPVVEEIESIKKMSIFLVLFFLFLLFFFSLCGFRLHFARHWNFWYILFKSLNCIQLIGKFWIQGSKHCIMI